MWWAVRNLIRRQAAGPKEFRHEIHGKTAAEWARYHGVGRLADEIDYYVSAGEQLSEADDHLAKEMHYRLNVLFSSAA